MLQPIDQFAQWIAPFFRQYFIQFVAVAAVTSFIADCIMHPENAINTFAIKIEDIVFAFFPSTPDDFKLVTLINNIVSTNSTAWSYVAQIVFGAFGFLPIYLAVKAVKLIPFF